LDLCTSLRVITIPANLEVIQANLFTSCRSLHQLIFELPSRLRQFALPSNDFDPLDIPDSVEVLSAGLLAPGSKSLLLQFGRESQLKKLEIDTCCSSILFLYHRGPYNRAFVRLHENTLRKFRSEFDRI
jgi:hypothetical protein